MRLVTNPAAHWNPAGPGDTGRQPTDHGTAQQPPFVPDLPRMRAAAQQHNMQFMPDFSQDDAR